MMAEAGPASLVLEQSFLHLLIESGVCASGIVSED